MSPSTLSAEKSAGEQPIGVAVARRRLVRDRFLSAVNPAQRARAEYLLLQPRCGGQGLRHWLRLLEWNGGSLPEKLPNELVEVYLRDQEVLPLHECADCGLAMPVKPDPESFECRPSRCYFPTCPVCGGATGLHARLMRELSTRRRTFAAGDRS